jgi:hypothetical protein
MSAGHFQTLDMVRQTTNQSNAPGMFMPGHPGIARH